MIDVQIENLVSGAEAHALLPQKAPFTMVDTLYFCEEKKAISGLLVTTINPLVADGYLQEPGIIENIAQTIALKAGFEAKNQNAEPKTGFIVSIKDLIVNNLVPVGEELITEVEIQMTFDNMLIIHGNSAYNNINVASCEMRLFIQK
jgi:predicted hotdog family 3-hydroxylacyl-ACP dehydratase